MATSLEVARLSRSFIHCNFTHCLRLLSPYTAKCSMSTSSSGTQASKIQVVDATNSKAKKISQAMKAYLERAQKYDTFMREEIAEYEIGKRHLANIMGADPNTFTQQDVDQAIEYLLPSGIFDKKARPFMKHPSEVIPKRKDAQFGMDGRPFHSLFYTGFPNYYQLMHEISIKIDNLHKFESLMADKGKFPSRERRVMLVGSSWIKKSTLDKKLNEIISEDQYLKLLKLLERLTEQGFALQEKDFIFSFRDQIAQALIQEVQPLIEDPESGRLYMEATGGRKTAKATVRIWEKGTGKYSVNGRDTLSHFNRIQEREQLIFPLQFTGLLREVDVEAQVEGGGPSGQAGAIRLATSIALQSFVSPTVRESMRLAGLLTRDPRVRERKKPGQEGARRKFTWKKR